MSPTPSPVGLAKPGEDPFPPGINQQDGDGEEEEEEMEEELTLEELHSLYLPLEMFALSEICSSPSSSTFLPLLKSFHHSLLEVFFRYATAYGCEDNERGEMWALDEEAWKKMGEEYSLGEALENAASTSSSSSSSPPSSLPQLFEDLVDQYGSGLAVLRYREFVRGLLIIGERLGDPGKTGGGGKKEGQSERSVGGTVGIVCVRRGGRGRTNGTTGGA